MSEKEVVSTVEETKRSKEQIQAEYEAVARSLGDVIYRQAVHTAQLNGEAEGHKKKMWELNQEASKLGQATAVASE